MRLPRALEDLVAGSTFGSAFRVTTFGESHGPGLGCVVDGCPAGLPLSEEYIQRDLDRRRPGQSHLVTARAEADRVEVLSGVFEGRTLGTPIALLVRNEDARSRAYEPMKQVYRPGHADFTWDAKFGHRDWRGGGRASARETVGRVAAGAVARALLRAALGVEVVAWVDRVGDIEAHADPDAVTLEAVESSLVRCPRADAAAAMEALIESVRKAGDSIGGVVAAVARGVPPGLGEPVFDKLDAALGAALLGIPAAKGVEIGSGFGGTRQRGSEHNDPFALDAAGAVITTSNRAGGMLGGISNGMPILARVAFKPVATIFHPQSTVTAAPHELTELQAKGRHDPCVLPRAVPIVEAMMLLTLADLWLRHRAATGAVPPGAG